jgi:hypothetical protein
MPKRTFTEKTGYSAKILNPGYLGEMTLEEVQVLKIELQNRSKLRKRWGFTEDERITNKKIQEKALEESASDD